MQYYITSLIKPNCTGKSLSEALIFASTNPQYDDRLFIDLKLLTQINTNSEHVVYKKCFECQNKNKKQSLYTTCSQLVFFLYWSRESMNNLSSYCGLIDSRMSASEKDLPVYLSSFFSITEWLSHFNKVVDDNYYHSIKVHTPLDHKSYIYE